MMSILLCGCREIGSNISTETEDSTEATTEAITEPVIDRTNDGKTVVCIDAGHGFGDVGCGPCYMGCYEYEVTMAIALKLKSRLEALGAEVILTHDGESYPDENYIMEKCEEYGIEYKEDKIKVNDIFSAYERALYEEILAVENNLDFFISLHINTVENADYVDGFEYYYCNDNPGATELEAFGHTISAKLEGDFVNTGYDFEEAYLVTKYADFPSVLLEMGYATNPTDAANLTSEAWQDNLATVLASEIVSFVGTDSTEA